MKSKKIINISIAFFTVLVVLICAYIIYGNSKINFESDKSIINKLSASSEESVTVLAKEKYKNYAAILYTVPSDEKIHFVYLIENRFFINKYDIKGGGSTNNGVDCTKVQNDNGELIFFIYDNADKISRCSIFELNSDGIISSKIEEIDTPRGAYIITKEYNFDDKGAEVLVFDGSRTLDEVNQYF